MNIRYVLIVFSALLILSPIFAHAENKPPVEDPCALLKPDDLSSLLGGTPVSKSLGDACLWTATGSPKKLNTLKFKNTGMAAEMAFMSARKNAAKGGPVIDEKELGDRGFARLLPVGVVLVAIKNGQLLQLQFRTEQPGTDKDLDSLKSVAKKVVASF